MHGGINKSPVCSHLVRAITSYSLVKAWCLMPYQRLPPLFHPDNCYDFDPRSYFKFQGHSTHRPKSCPCNTSLLPCWIWRFHTIVVHVHEGCVMTLTKFHISKVNVSAHITKIRVEAITPNCNVGSRYYFKQLLSMNHGCIIVYDPWLCHDLDPVMSPISRSQFTHSQNLCPGPNALLPC